jgi:hypothetical protein
LRFSGFVTCSGARSKQVARLLRLPWSRQRRARLIRTAHPQPGLRFSYHDFSPRWTR